MKIKILGTKYTVSYESPEKNKDLESHRGICKMCEKLIIIRNDLTPEYTKATLRHEIIHAFLYECGLSHDALAFDRSWCCNEEMVDFFSIQIPKLYRIFEKYDLL